MKLSLILEVVSKGADRIGRMTRETRALADRGMAPLERATNAATRAAERHDRQLSRVSASTFRWMRMTLRTADAIDRAGARAARFVGRAGLKGIELGAIGAAKGLGLIIRKGMDFARTAASWGALGLGAGAGWLVGGTIGLASDFEQFQVVLENTEGSAEKARKAMDWVKTFAKTTPYEVSQVMEAFVAMKSYGIDPMSGSLTSLGNAASGMNKDLMQAVEMLADAQTGEFERLKEFGVRAKVAGDKVTFTYMRSGKEISRTAKTSAAEINKAVVGIFDDRFSGMMDRQSRTLKGLWSNLQDMFANFQLDIADAGFFDTVKGKLQSLLDWVNAKANDGTLKKWAEEISTNLKAAFEWADRFARDIPWADVATGIGTIASAAAKAAGWIGRAATALREYRYESARRLLENTLNSSSPFVTDYSRGLARQQLDQLDRDFGKKKDAPYKGGPLRNGIRGYGEPAVKPTWGGALQNRPPALLTKPGSGARPIDGKVKVEVELKGEGARGARTRVSSSSQQVPVSVWTGALRGQANVGPA